MASERSPSARQPPRSARAVPAAALRVSSSPGMAAATGRLRRPAVASPCCHSQAAAAWAAASAVRSPKLVSSRLVSERVSSPTGRAAHWVAVRASGRAGSSASARGSSTPGCTAPCIQLWGQVCGAAASAGAALAVSALSAVAVSGVAAVSAVDAPSPAAASSPPPVSRRSRSPTTGRSISPETHPPAGCSGVRAMAGAGAAQTSPSASRPLAIRSFQSFMLLPPDRS